jgi:quinol monooxygenase YgiN
MSVVYAIEFHVRQGQRERFLGLLHPVLDRMRREPTFVNATLHVDPADPDRFFLHET